LNKRVRFLFFPLPRNEVQLHPSFPPLLLLRRRERGIPCAEETVREPNVAPSPETILSFRRPNSLQFFPPPPSCKNKKSLFPKRFGTRSRQPVFSPLFFLFQERRLTELPELLSLRHKRIVLESPFFLNPRACRVICGWPEVPPFPSANVPKDTFSRLMRLGQLAAALPPPLFPPSPELEKRVELVHFFGAAKQGSAFTFLPLFCLSTHAHHRIFFFGGYSLRSTHHAFFFFLGVPKMNYYSPSLFLPLPLAWLQTSFSPPSGKAGWCRLPFPPF